MAGKPCTLAQKWKGGWFSWFYNEIFRDFIKSTLGPALRGSNLTKDIFLMVLDDNRYLLPSFANVVSRVTISVKIF